LSIGLLFKVSAAPFHFEVLMYMIVFLH
jgi:NADH:ubiquinone oxidoreductase subunit 2 (subunit N)